MPAGKARTARLVHNRIERVHGGPHVGTDTFVKPVKTSAPVRLDSRGQAVLVCELEGCNGAYNFRLLTAKERLTKVLKRALVVAVIIAVATIMAQSGRWVYDIGAGWEGLGSTLVGAGMVIYFLMAVWTLMSLWFWPNRYALYPIPIENKPSGSPSRAQPSNVASGHTVKLRRAKP